MPHYLTAFEADVPINAIQDRPPGRRLQFETLPSNDVCTMRVLSHLYPPALRYLNNDTCTLWCSSPKNFLTGALAS